MRTLGGPPVIPKAPRSFSYKQCSEELTTSACSPDAALRSYLSLPPATPFPHFVSATLALRARLAMIPKRVLGASALRSTATFVLRSASTTSSFPSATACQTSSATYIGRGLRNKNERGSAQRKSCQAQGMDVSSVMNSLGPKETLRWSQCGCILDGSGQGCRFQSRFREL